MKSYEIRESVCVYVGFINLDRFAGEYHAACGPCGTISPWAFTVKYESTSTNGLSRDILRLLPGGKSYNVNFILQ